MTMNSYFSSWVILFFLTIFAAPMGCVSLWRRCVYVGDGLSHASILSVAIAGAFAIPASSTQYIFFLLVFFLNNFYYILV